VSADEAGGTAATSAEGRPAPRVLARAEHRLSRTLVSANAIKVLYRLHRAGFASYLVGGAVRDLLIGRTPKDFDVGTNARPSQVKHLFRNARLIGRRFRLALITFAEETVEVATFRRSPEPPEIEDGPDADVVAPVAEVEEYGTPAEDAWRRDFTVNGLFYNVADFSVIDHVGGLGDLERGVIRTIGEPNARFLEDPVRMMRAVEYAARLGFRIDEETALAIAGQCAEIRRAAPARIAFELGESLKGGQALPIFRGLEEHGLLLHVVPEAHAALSRRTDGLLWRLLAVADQAVRRGDRVPEEALLGTLFLPSFLTAVEIDGRAVLEIPEAEQVIREELEAPAQRLAFSNYRGHLLRHAFMMLLRLSALPRSAKSVVRTVRHEAFPTAWSLARFLATATGLHKDAVAAWEQAIGRLEQGLPPVEGGRWLEGGEGTKRRRRRPRKRRSGRQIAPAAQGGAA
jgi:poly(A) polymerase